MAKKIVKKADKSKKPAPKAAKSAKKGAPKAAAKAAKKPVKATKASAKKAHPPKSAKAVKVAKVAPAKKAAKIAPAKVAKASKAEKPAKAAKGTKAPPQGKATPHAKPIPEKPAKKEKIAKAPKEEIEEPVVEELEEIEAEEEESDEVVLTDAEGRRYCRVKDCDQLSTVDGYCRYHYLLFWKKIQVRKKILTEGKLERYIEELTARYPDKFLDMLRKDLRSDKEFLTAIAELEIDESANENEFEDEAQNYIEEVRGMGEPTSRGDDEDF